MVFDRKLGKSFRKIGEVYHHGRRDYPNGLISDIIKISKIKKESLILDIGCGTGKSTIPFAKKGYKIMGIDISKNMLKVAKRLSFQFDNVEYRKVSFEKSQLPPNSFDLILVGTAMHWLDPKKAYKKAHQILRKHGYIAIFWEPVYYLRRLPKEIGGILSAKCPNYPRDAKKKSSVLKIKKRLLRYKLFSRPITKKYHTTHTFSNKQFLNLINSYSWVISLNRIKKEQLIQKLIILLDKRVKPITLSKEFVLVIAARK